MCTPVAFSFFPSGLTTIPQEGMDVEGSRLEEKHQGLTCDFSEGDVFDRHLVDVKQV